MSRTYNKMKTVEGPADKAARWLANSWYIVVDVVGTNGCDFKNETAEEYLVEVREMTGSEDRSDAYDINLVQLLDYHTGDREHYIAELRQELHTQMVDYVKEATGLNSVQVYARLGGEIRTALAAVDSIVERVTK